MLKYVALKIYAHELQKKIYKNTSLIKLALTMLLLYGTCCDDIAKEQKNLAKDDYNTSTYNTAWSGLSHFRVIRPSTPPLPSTLILHS